MNYGDRGYIYGLNAGEPLFQLTNSGDRMMVKLQVEDDMWNFHSIDMLPNLAHQSFPEFSRKRKYSSEFGESQDYSDSTAAKTAKVPRFQANPRLFSGAYTTVQIPPLAAQSTLSSEYGHTSGIDMPKQSNNASQLAQEDLYAVPPVMNMTQGDYKLLQDSPSLHPYDSYSSLAHTGRSPSSMSEIPSGSSVLPSPSTLAAPVFIRATALPQASSTMSAQPSNPYSMYPTKAVLEIDGDLDKMSEEWTQEELDSKRRLVEFKRSQHGSTISTSFASIAPEARPACSISISCIWWEEKDECFITSVDTIYLLEQLVNARFTVEEKNRIRRNLEVFRPLTVSKAKQDSEEFFKVIMGFPKPKPRNIEKDVKVFPWRILSFALNKIISKYSASYSSTAEIGAPPVTSACSAGFMF